MAGLAEMAEIASRYDTAVSWAMLRALSELGVPVRLPPTRAHAHDHARAAEVAYGDLEWCFRNASSPLDLLIR